MTNVTHRTSAGTVEQNGHSKKSKTSSDSTLPEAPEVDQLTQWVWWATYNLPPNIKTFTLAFYANFHKATMIFYILGLMWYFDNYSLGCWVYAAMHGTYGFLWNLKTCAFPDKTHQQRMSIGSLVPMFSVLIGYWYIPYMMASGQSEQNPSYERVFWSVLVYVMGAAFMMISDAQKFFCLKLRKGLIDYGMFAHSRNPNYVGEMMLYGAFAIISNRWVPWIILLSVWCTVFALMIYLKELSFRRKEGWEKYKERSYVLLPKIYASHLVSIVVYGGGLALGLYIYNQGGLYEVLRQLKFK